LSVRNESLIHVPITSKSVSIINTLKQGINDTMVMEAIGSK
jgi:hypothetical protein